MGSLLTWWLVTPFMESIWVYEEGVIWADMALLTRLFGPTLESAGLLTFGGENVPYQVFGKGFVLVYLMAPKALIRRSELPKMWGLLDPEPRVVVEAPPRSRPSRSASVLAGVLRSISRSNTRDMMRAHGVKWREFKPDFPTPATDPNADSS